MLSHYPFTFPDWLALFSALSSNSVKFLALCSTLPALPIPFIAKIQQWLLFQRESGSYQISFPALGLLYAFITLEKLFLLLLNVVSSSLALILTSSLLGSEETWTFHSRKALLPFSLPHSYDFSTSLLVSISVVVFAFSALPLVPSVLGSVLGHFSYAVYCLQVLLFILMGQLLNIRLWL